MEVGVTYLLQSVGLADIKCRDVCITKAKPLLQVWVSFKKIPMPSNLQEK